MEQTRKIPAEAVDLYTRFIHGEVSRRDFLKGVDRFAVAGLSAAGDRRSADAELRVGAAGSQGRRADHGQLRDHPVTQWQWVDSRLFRPAVQPDTRSEPDETARGARHPRESRSQSAYRRRGAALCAGELHCLCAGRADLDRRISERRLQRRPAVRQDRSRQDDPGFHRRRAVAEVTCRSATEKSAPPVSALAAACPTRWRRQLGADLAAAAPFYGGAPRPEEVPKIKAAILIHHGALDKRLVGGLSGVRGGAEEEQHPLRRPHLSEFRARLLQ